MGHETNFGGYDDNAFHDRKAVDYLTQVLLDTNYIMPYLEAGDKRPNFDGQIELLADADGKKVREGCFDVQVKSLNHDYENHNRRRNQAAPYKYSCETKAMNGVLRGATYNPVLLFLVDYPAKKIFWFHLSMQFCFALKIGACAHKTIYFDSGNALVEHDRWILKLRTLYRENTALLRNPGGNSFLLPPDCQRVPVELQEQFDRLNHLLDHELWFIKQRYFPDTWKLGIAYLKGGDAAYPYSRMGIYRIKRGENDWFIKVFDDADSYLSQVFYGGGYTLPDAVRSILEHLIEDFFKRDAYCFGLLPDAALIEILYEEIDHALAVSAMRGREKGQDHLILGYPRAVISIGEAEDLIRAMDAPEISLGCLRTLETRGYRTIERVWGHLSHYHVDREDAHCTSFKEDGGRVQTDRENMRRLFNGFTEFYRDILQKFGPESSPALTLENHYTLFVRTDFSSYSYFAVQAERFQLTWVPAAEGGVPGRQAALARTRRLPGYRGSGSSLLPNNPSWYKLWRVFCKTRFLACLGGHAGSLITEYAAKQ